jgi:hypothetical protein
MVASIPDERMVFSTQIGRCPVSIAPSSLPINSRGFRKLSADLHLMLSKHLDHQFLFKDDVRIQMKALRFSLVAGQSMPPPAVSSQVRSQHAEEMSKNLDQ